MKQKKKARPRGRLEHQLYPRYLTLPAFILFTVFFILPILGGVGISLTNWTVSRPSITRFVGLKNYITMFQDDDILLAFKNTAIFTVAIVILRNLFAILLALALVKKLYTRTYLRTIFYIPAVLSYVVVGIMFTAMFQMNGTFNQILNAFGIPCTKEWLASGDTALLDWAESAAKRQAETPTPAVDRTWIQAYNAIQPPYNEYGVQEIGDEIRALREEGLTGGFMAWNAACSLTKLEELRPLYEALE